MKVQVAIIKPCYGFIKVVQTYMGELFNNKQTKRDKIRSFFQNLFEGCIGVGCVLPLFFSFLIVGFVFFDFLII
ncbi:hypothetical protein [Virgibacillus litoralis]|uniref:Uncharacterized protein n=1 Tax=Virgibacillus litoralis TaxID=578221 RepID=A0ABS4H9J8_9BACI|nr:hypothetical protein [Virgibacillus litoralis]MBP1947548.1 hypothetical protein [Virgibacillus litoralis]